MAFSILGMAIYEVISIISMEIIIERLLHKIISWSTNYIPGTTNFFFELSY